MTSRVGGVASEAQIDRQVPPVGSIASISLSFQARFHSLVHFSRVQGRAILANSAHNTLRIDLFLFRPVVFVQKFGAVFRICHSRSVGVFERRVLGLGRGRGAVPIDFIN